MFTVRHISQPVSQLSIYAPARSREDVMEQSASAKRLRATLSTANRGVSHHGLFIAVVVSPFTRDAVLHAFRRRALELHPDCGGSAQLFHPLLGERELALRLAVAPMSAEYKQKLSFISCPSWAFGDVKGVTMAAISGTALGFDCQSPCRDPVPPLKPKVARDANGQSEEKRAAQIDFLFESPSCETWDL